MQAKQYGRTLNSRELHALIHPLRFLADQVNLLHLAGEYLTLAAAIVPTIYFCETRESWGLSWWWNIPVVALAVAIVGVGQHRLAGLGHEASHYMLVKNRVWNELLSDLFCFFPLLSTAEQYRVIHLGHHDHTNDWEKDPELQNMGKTRMMDRFPMSKSQFAYHFFLRILWPPSFFRYLWDNVYVTGLGNGIHPYRDQPANRPFLRLTTILGMGYMVAMAIAVDLAARFGSTATMWAVAVCMWFVASLVAVSIPQSWYYVSGLKPVYSNKITSVLRLGYYTTFAAFMGQLMLTTGRDLAPYFWVLWALPLLTTFPYYMLLRDLFQHANADDGKLTNSRVTLCNPILRWAMFVYGQDYHVTHHLYPAVPHYNLPKLHQILLENNEEYAEHVVECHGMIFNQGDGHPTMLDVMEQPTSETGAISLPPWSKAS